MNELDNAIYCEAYNRMNKVERINEEKEDAYMTLCNMKNMLIEHGRENIDLPIPLRNEKPSKKISSRYGINYDSEFVSIWVVLERLCNGEYTLIKKD